MCRWRSARRAGGKGKKGGRYCSHTNRDCGKRYGSKRWNLKKRGGDDETIATKADKRLLPHRDKSRISGKQIPGLRKSQVITDLNQEAHFRAASPGRHRKQHTDRDEHNGKPDATGTG